MKKKIVAFASLPLLAIAAPSSKADTLKNNSLDPVDIEVYGAGQRVCTQNVSSCLNQFQSAGNQIEHAIYTNLLHIRSEHERLDNNIENTTSNASSINTNTSAISSNASSINTNTSDISSNASSINTNTSAISSNDADISTNASAISSNDADISTNASTISSNTSSINTNTSAISSNDADISSLKSLVKSTSSGIKIGAGSNPALIHETGLEVGGENLIRRSADGAVHIGKNSLVTIEEGGRQKMWATNAAGESIDIDITNGSRLLINGRDVEKSIDNVGALSAALGSVPAISADSPFTCGIGAGTHSSAYALSAGCASRVSDRVSLNAALATVINNHTGDKDDNLSARAGFTFKLGKVDDSPKVAARKAAALHDEVVGLRKENLQQKQLNDALLARLERLEKIANIDKSVAGDIASKN